MPFGDPGGNYASGGAVNQGGPSGPNSPGNNGNMGGGGGSGGSNFSSAYAGSSPSMGSGYTIPFGWQPERSTQWSPEEYAAFNPANINYTNTPMMGSPNGTVVGGGYARWGGGRPNPGGAGGANSGQGGMGAGSLGAGSMGAGSMGAGSMGAGNVNGILAALAKHDFQRRNKTRRTSGRSLTRYLKERNNAIR